MSAKKNAHARGRTPKVTRLDSPTAARELKRRAATTTPPRADRFVVGYRSRGNIVFGKDTRKDKWPGYTDAAQPLTLSQASKAREALPSRGAVIFELVPFATKRVAV